MLKLLCSLSAAILLLVGTAGCSRSANIDAEHLLSARAAAGPDVRALIDTTALNVVLVLATSQCLTCSLDLHRWRAYARNRSGHFTVFFTDTITAEQRTTLGSMRIPFHELNAASRRSFAGSVPVVSVFAPRALGMQSILFAMKVSDERRLLLVDSLERVQQTASDP